jgi:Fur family ferric uptake transcriptional regulator
VKLLASIGLLRELDFAEGHKHYELAAAQAAPHHHLVCVACSQAIEFEQDSLYDLGLDVAGAYGFRLVDVQYKVFGICPPCQEAGGRK